MGTCKTCRFWIVSNKARTLGVCTLAKSFQDKPVYEGITKFYAFIPAEVQVISDRMAGLETLSDFGCNQYNPKPGEQLE